jgi:predicted TIM-barrel fold metal-dependent hydrolase
MVQEERNAESLASPAGQHAAAPVTAFISVDDHVLEAPDIWAERLPQRYQSLGPQVRRERGQLGSSGWIPTSDDSGSWADVWYYGDVAMPLMTSFAGTNAPGGFDENLPVTFDDIRPGAWKQADRLADMTLNSTDISICFPNVVPRFCGQTFLEGRDKDLGLLCVQAYNDWIIDEWCAGAGYGRLIPMTIVPLWDPALAAAEIRRCAAKGSHAVSFTEGPTFLGLPSLYSGAWEPFFAACEETETTVCMHIGSSSKMATTSPEAPLAAKSALTFQYGMYSLIDVLLSGLLMRFPTLNIMYSEGNVGWIPYVLERLDTAWREYSAGYSGVDLPEPPSHYFQGRVYGCIVDDEVGLALRDRVGMGQICFETDFPHGAGTFPESMDAVRRMVNGAGLNDGETYDFLRGNAIRALGLGRFGVAR